jgi:hypothetical protein
MRNFRTLKNINGLHEEPNFEFQNFSHRKALGVKHLISVVSPLVTLRQIFFQKFSLQVIRVVSTPVSCFYHVQGPHKQTDIFRYYIIDVYWIEKSCFKYRFRRINT